MLRAEGKFSQYSEKEASVYQIMFQESQPSEFEAIFPSPTKGKIRCGNHFRETCGQCPFDLSKPEYIGRENCKGHCKWSSTGKYLEDHKPAQ